MFEAWGRFVHRRRWAVLVGSALLLGASVAAVLYGGTLTSGGPPGSHLESARAQKLINQELQPKGQQNAGSSFLVIFSSTTRSVDDPAFRSALEEALQPLSSDPRVTGITTPYTVATPEAAAALTSKDRHRALAVVSLKDSSVAARKYIDSVSGQIHSNRLQVLVTGNVAINRAFDTTLEADLQRAEIISLPTSLILLLIVFGAVISALIPLGVGLLSVVGGVGGTLLLSHLTDVSTYAINLVTLIGLGVAIDYSLFMVNRFREELATGLSREDAVARTVASLGRAITFSGVTVAVGLSGLLFFQGTFLASMGAAGAIVVALAVVYGLTFLPALLSILGPRVDLLRIPSRRRAGGSAFWRSFANGVMRRPLLVLVPTVAALLAAGFPFLHLRLANGDVDMLPRHVQARQGYDVLVSDFPGQDQTSIDVVVNYPDGNPLTAERIGAVYDLSRRVAAMPGVLRVEGPLNLDPKLGRADYQRMYTQPAAQQPPEVQAALKLGTGRHIVVLTALTNHTASSDEARQLVRDIRAAGVGGGGQVLVDGQTAFDMDIIAFILGHSPLAIAFVLLVTYVVLFLLTGSLVLPLKAVVMNMLSIAASFGALVWIFQDGHLTGLLGFTPQSIDPTIPVIMFSLMFGLSMDYEVLLVSRIQEEYRKTGDNTYAVAEGLQRSGRLITGAAAIMIAVFLAFGVGEVVYIKAIGLGLAIAIAIDATLVRALLVPSVMRLLGRLNWWAPAPFAWLHERLRLSEVPATVTPPLVGGG